MRILKGDWLKAKQQVSFLSPAPSSVNRSLAFSLPSICCILWLQVEYLKVARVLAARRLPWEDKLDVDRDRTLGLPPASSKCPRNQRLRSVIMDSTPKMMEISFSFPQVQGHLLVMPPGMLSLEQFSSHFSPLHPLPWVGVLLSFSQAFAAFCGHG